MRDLFLDPYAARKHLWLPPEKRDRYEEISQKYFDDYQRVNGSNFRLPEDDEEQRRAEAERRSQLATLLTPGELEEHELRTSGLGGYLEPHRF